MYKLLQLQTLDHDLVVRLSTKFAEYDDGDDGVVVIGQDVPSARQVAAMQKQVKRVKKKLLHEEYVSNKSAEDSVVLVKMWDEHKKHKFRDRVKQPPPFVSSASSNDLEKNMNNSNNNNNNSNHQEQINEEFTKLKDLDFHWSKRLWKQAAREIGFIANTLLFIYLMLSYFVFIYHSEQMNEVQGWYFIAATLSTVCWKTIRKRKKGEIVEIVCERHID
jgi:hypothetical protein